MSSCGYMKMKLQELRKADEKQAMRFAATGMHFDWYFDSPFLLNLYTRYFWYLESNRATQVIAAYEGDTFAGVLLAEIKGEKRKKQSFWRGIYVRVFDALQRLYSPKGGALYEQTNAEMFQKYRETHFPDGGILFLAANPDVKTKGIGTALLAELAHREAGKEIYLFTDDACTYQFYEHRGFERAGEKDIVLELSEKTVPLKCLLYRKKMNENGE